MTFTPQPYPGREGFLGEAERLAKRQDIHSVWFAQSEHYGKPHVQLCANDMFLAISHNQNMAPRLLTPEQYDELREQSGWFARAWRDFYKVSGGVMAEVLETSKGRVSDMENGAVNKRGQQARFNRDWLEAYCAKLGVSAGDLIDTNPFRQDARFLEVRRAWEAADERGRETIAAAAAMQLKLRA